MTISKTETSSALYKSLYETHQRQLALSNNRHLELQIITALLTEKDYVLTEEEEKFRNKRITRVESLIRKANNLFDGLQLIIHNPETPPSVLEEVTKLLETL